MSPPFFLIYTFHLFALPVIAFAVKFIYLSVTKYRSSLTKQQQSTTTVHTSFCVCLFFFFTRPGLEPAVRTTLSQCLMRCSTAKPCSPQKTAPTVLITISTASGKLDFEWGLIDVWIFSVIQVIVYLEEISQGQLALYWIHEGVRISNPKGFISEVDGSEEAHNLPLMSVWTKSWMCGYKTERETKNDCVAVRGAEMQPLCCCNAACVSLSKVLNVAW